MPDTAHLRVRADSDQVSLLNQRLGNMTREGVKAERATDRLKQTTSSLNNIIAGLAIGAATAALSKYADEWTNLTNRLKLVTDTERELATAQRDVFNIAQETRAELSATGTLYARLQQNAGNLITSQKDLADITRTVNQAIAVSGATTDEANGAIRQLAQGIASGTLRGDEFNSVMENTPRIAQAIADGLGVARGELREMAADGKLTAAAIIEAMRDQADVIESEFNVSVTTISQSWTYLNNIMVRAVGNLDEVTDGSAIASNGIRQFADQIDALTGDSTRLYEVLQNLQTVGTLLAALYAGKLLTGVIGVVKASGAYATITAAVTATTRGATFQTNAYGQVIGRTTGLMIAATGAARALRTAIGLLGGPLGVVILAATALYEYQRRAKDARLESLQLQDRIDQLAGSFSTLTDEQRKQQVQANNFDMQRIRSELIDLSAEITKTEKNARTASGPLANVANIRLTELRAEYSRLQEQLKKIGEQQQALFQSGLPEITGEKPNKPAGTTIDEEAEKAARKQEDRALRQALAAAKQREDEFNRVREDLMKESEVVLAEYDRRYSLIEEKTRFAGEARSELMKRLNEQFENDILGGFGEATLTTEDEIAKINEEFLARREAILSNTRITEEARTELERELTQRRNDMIADLEASRSKMLLNASGQIFNDLATISSTYLGKQNGIYKGLFAASKAFAIATAAINIQQGISEAISLGWPAMLPAVAQVTAASAGIVQTISSTNYAGAFDNGGRIPSGSFGLVGEYGPELVEGPVTVRSRRETAEAFNAAKQDTGNNSGNMNNIKIVNVIDPSVVSDFLGSSQGEEIIMNTIQNNPELVRSIGNT